MFEPSLIRNRLIMKSRCSEGLQKAHVTIQHIPKTLYACSNNGGSAGATKGIGVAVVGWKIDKTKKQECDG